MATKKSKNNIFQIVGIGALGALLYFKVIKGGMTKEKAIDVILKNFPTTSKVLLASKREDYLIARATAIEKGDFIFEAKEYSPTNPTQFSIGRYATMDGRNIGDMTQDRLIEIYKKKGLIK